MIEGAKRRRKNMTDSDANLALDNREAKANREVTWR